MDESESEDSGQQSEEIYRRRLNKQRDQAMVKAVAAAQGARPSWVKDSLGVRGNPIDAGKMQPQVAYESQPIMRRQHIPDDAIGKSEVNTLVEAATTSTVTPQPPSPIGTISGTFPPGDPNAQKVDIKMTVWMGTVGYQPYGGGYDWYGYEYWHITTDSGSFTVDANTLEDGKVLSNGGLTYKRVNVYCGPPAVPYDDRPPKLTLAATAYRALNPNWATSNQVERYYP